MIMSTQTFSLIVLFHIFFLSFSLFFFFRFDVLNIILEVFLGERKKRIRRLISMLITNLDTNIRSCLGVTC